MRGGWGQVSKCIKQGDETWVPAEERQALSRWSFPSPEDQITFCGVRYTYITTLWLFLGLSTQKFKSEKNLSMVPEQDGKVLALRARRRGVFCTRVECTLYRSDWKFQKWRDGMSLRVPVRVHFWTLHIFMFYMDTFYMHGNILGNLGFLFLQLCEIFRSMYNVYHLK